MMKKAQALRRESVPLFLSVFLSLATSLQAARAHGPLTAEAEREDEAICAEMVELDLSLNDKARILYQKILNQGPAKEGDSRWKIEKCQGHPKCNDFLVEWISSESKYLDDLDYLINALQVAQQNGRAKLPPPSLRQLLPRLQSLRGSVHDYFTQVEAVLRGEVMWENLVPSKSYFEQSLSLAKIYKVHLQELGRNQKSGEFVAFLDGELRKREQMGLDSYLIRPLQRTPRLLLLLEGVQKNFPASRKPTREDFSAKRGLERMVKNVTKEIKLINEGMRQFEEVILGDERFLSAYLNSPMAEQDTFFLDVHSDLERNRQVSVLREIRKLGQDKMPAEEVRSLILMPDKARQDFYQRIKALSKMMPHYFKLRPEERIFYFRHLELVKSAREQEIEFEHLPPSYQRELMARDESERWLFLKALQKLGKSNGRGQREGSNPFTEDNLNQLKQMAAFEEARKAGVELSLLSAETRNKLFKQDRMERDYYLQRIRKLLAEGVPYSTFQSPYWEHLLVNFGSSEFGRDISKLGISFDRLPADMKVTISYMPPVKRKEYLGHLKTLRDIHGPRIYSMEGSEADRRMQEIAVREIQNEAGQQKVLVEFNLLSNEEKLRLVHATRDQRKELFKRLKNMANFGRAYLGT